MSQAPEVQVICNESNNQPETEAADDITYALDPPEHDAILIGGGDQAAELALGLAISKQDSEVITVDSMTASIDQQMQEAHDFEMKVPTIKIPAAMKKASQKMYDILVAKHGKERALQILKSEQDRQQRASMKPTILARIINEELHNPQSVFYNKELLEALSVCELHSTNG